MYMYNKSVVPLFFRNQFYEEVKQCLESNKLLIDSEEDIQQVMALIALIEYGPHDTRTHQLNIYKKLYAIISDQEPSQELIRQFVEGHKSLGTMSKETAKYKILQIVHKLQCYGMEYHEAVLGSDAVHLGVGPAGVLIYNSDMELQERYM